MKPISLEGNLDYVEGASGYNPVDDINSEIDRKLLLEKFTDEERKIMELLEMGYTTREICEKTGVSKGEFNRIIRRIKVFLGA